MIDEDEIFEEEKKNTYRIFAGEFRRQAFGRSAVRRYDAPILNIERISAIADDSSGAAFL